METAKQALSGIWRARLRLPLVAALLMAVASCGGGGGSGTATLPSSAYAARCAVPRSGTDPASGKPFPDAQGTVDDEKNWLRAWTSELYLWYREVPNADPSAYATPIDYFNVLKTRLLTASGKPKDRFHFTYSTAAWEALAQSGVEASYGVQWVSLSSAPPYRVVAAYTEPGSPGAAAGVARGAQVIAIDGVDAVTPSTAAQVNELNAAIAPSAAGELHQFTLLDVGATTARTVPLTSANVQTTPVQNVGVVPGFPGVGYMLFNDHLAVAEAKLIDAVHQLAGITDLVLDIRYNGGGYLDIASELSFMIAGSNATAGKTFEKIVFNDRYPTTDPLTGLPLRPVPFESAAGGYSVPRGQALPSLGLSRVFVLTGPGTCSASESIINSLRGIDVEVIQVGSPTCGKPYGFYPQDNCGTTYFSIEFEGVNAKGFGDYDDGFTPGGSGPANLPGCQVADDFSHALGDPQEARLAAALGYRASRTCPPPTHGLVREEAAIASLPSDGQLVRSPWRENRILRR